MDFDREEASHAQNNNKNFAEESFSLSFEDEQITQSTENHRTYLSGLWEWSCFVIFREETTP